MLLTCFTLLFILKNYFFCITWKPINLKIAEVFALIWHLHHKFVYNISPNAFWDHYNYATCLTGKFEVLVTDICISSFSLACLLSIQKYHIFFRLLCWGMYRCHDYALVLWMIQSALEKPFNGMNAGGSSSMILK
jgi:hypothetical protein